MSTILANGDLIEARVVTKDASGGENLNVYHYLISSVAASCLDTDFAVVFDAMAAPLYKQVMSSNCFYDGVQVAIINRPIQPAPVASAAHSGAGTVAPTSAPTQVAGIISWVTALAGPRFRGRNYIGNLWATAVTAAGFPTAGYLTLIGNLASGVATFNSVVNGGRSCSCALGIVHRITNAFTAVVSFLLPAKFATQRRRGNYGKNRTPPI